MKKEYIKFGTCIFCGRSSPEVSFLCKPHTTPRSLGSNRIGFDVCDECNSFFGTPDKSMRPRISVENSVKEILGLIRFMIQLEREGHENDILKSIYFNYWRSRNTLQIKPSFSGSPSFRRVFIKQFKRGLYELFLQEYHLETGNGLDSSFDRIRNFARYGIGNVPVWHFQTRLLLIEDDLSIPRFHFSESSLNKIDTYGFYELYIWGFWFLLEVTPRASLTREVYLQNQAKEMGVGGFVVKNLVELKDLNDIDFTLRQLYGR